MPMFQKSQRLSSESLICPLAHAPFACISIPLRTGLRSSMVLPTVSAPNCYGTWGSLIYLRRRQPKSLLSKLHNPFRLVSLTRPSSALGSNHLILGRESTGGVRVLWSVPRFSVQIEDLPRVTGLTGHQQSEQESFECP